MAANAWDIDVGASAIRFWVRHMMITKIHGRFARWSGTISLDEDDLARSSVAVRIDATSIEPRWAAFDVDAPLREARIKSASFLDVASYPEITFRSTSIEKVGAEYRIAGVLSLHGVEREVSLEAELRGIARDRDGSERARFAARTTFDRRDYGLVWDSTLETGSIVVGEKVGVSIELDAVRSVPEARVAV